MSYIVTEEWLRNQLANHLDETVVIDTRFEMGNPDAGKESYLESHIPGAVYLDLDKDLSSPPQKHGGGHPLPDLDHLAKRLGELGINQDKTVVIYDQKDSLFASRAWWVLHYMGHKNVYLLDGGFKHWKNAGNEVTDQIEPKEPTTFTPYILKEVEVDIDEVKEQKNRSSVVLIDSRSENRYLGKVEPMYQKAGHIPGAKNFFWKNVLNEDGTWKNQVQLRNNFSSLSKDDDIIVSCGSGVSACPNIVALKMIGYENIKLYPGSFSDWISYETNELATEEE